MLGDRGPDAPYAGSKALYDAVEVASKQKPKAEKTTCRRAGPHAGGGRQAEQRLDERPATTCSAPTASRSARTSSRCARATTTRRSNCKELLSDYEPERRARRTKYAEGHRVPGGARGARPAARPPARGCSRCRRASWSSRASRAEPVRARAPLLRARGRLRAERQGHQEPRAELRPEHERAARDHGVHGQGPRGVRARHEADRRARARLRDARRGLAGARTSAGLRPRTSSSASRSRSTTRSSRWRRSTTRRTPRASTAAPAPQIKNIGTIQEAQDLAESLRIGALPIDLKLISQTQVSATLGQQALDQGLTAAAAGLALTILFLLIFYRVLGVVATVALLDLRGAAVRAGQADPDHAHAAGHRGNGAHAGGGGRRQHRHVRANKGGGAARADRSRPRSPPATRRRSGRSSTPTS